MKRNRLLKLQEAKGKCEVCGEPASQVHHLDEDKANHKLENLAILCVRCHAILHTGPTIRAQSTSKYRRLYGMNLREMTEHFGGSETYYLMLHRKGQLAEFLSKRVTECQHG